MNPVLLAVWVVVAVLEGTQETSADEEPTKEPRTRTCAIRVAEAEFDLATLQEAEGLAPIQLQGDQAILDLLTPLWEARSTERLRFLAGKHARDRSRVLVKRAKLARERGTALLEVLRTECFGESASPEAVLRFESLGCALIQADKELADVDLAYTQEVRTSIAELRSLEFATEQRLIQAEFEVNRAQKERDLRASRLRSCK